MLFNRFYQPDIDLEELQVARTLHLSTSVGAAAAPALAGDPLRRRAASLAVTGGVHTAERRRQGGDGRRARVQMVSALLRNGPAHLRHAARDLTAWMEEHECESLATMRGSMSLLGARPRAYERANYMLMLQSWKDVDMPFAVTGAALDVLECRTRTLTVRQ